MFSRILFIAWATPALLFPLLATVPESRELSPPSKAEKAGTLFSSLPPDQSGIASINPIDTKHPLKRLYTGAFGGGGVAAEARVPSAVRRRLGR